MPRNKNRKKLANFNEMYRDILEEREVPYIKHYVTPIMSRITKKQRGSLAKTQHIWKTGDKFYKLANKYYGSPNYWWIIAWYNHAPTEAHVKPGRTLLIPLPLEKIISYVRTF